MLYSFTIKSNDRFNVLFQFVAKFIYFERIIKRSLGCKMSTTKEVAARPTKRISLRNSFDNKNFVIGVTVDFSEKAIQLNLEVTGISIGNERNGWLNLIKLKA